MTEREKVIRGLECCSQGAKEPYTPTIRFCAECPYNKPVIPCTRALALDALELLKAQEASIMTPEKAAVLQGFLLDIPSSESILNSVNCHAISLEDASRIIAICAYACDVMSPSGFIGWLKERFNQDLILKGCVAE